MTSRPLALADKKLRTLVLICRRDFCRMVDQVLISEGVADFQHGDLRLVGRTDLEARVGTGATEAFVIKTDAEHAERLKTLLGACPISGESQEAFEFYTGQPVRDASYPTAQGLLLSNRELHYRANA